MKKVFKRFVGDATLFVVAAMCVLFFTQCKKKKEENKPAGGGISTSFLVGKKWQTKAITINPGVDMGSGTPITDLYAQLEPCVTDNFSMFKADGTGVQDEGPTKCDANGPQTINFNWKLKDDGTLEGMEEDGFIGTYKAVKTDDNTVTITASGKFEDDNEVRTMVMVIKAI